jgi:hypothetical protein
MNEPRGGATAAVLAMATVRSWIASHAGERVTIAVGSHDEDADLPETCPLLLATRLGPFEADSWRACISVALPELPASRLRIDPERILCVDVVADGKSLRISASDGTILWLAV